ncbi:GIY-YIG nuclease family protein [Cyanobium sp. BA20m-p-22]|uniref:GIY-YIG nuclease family protein n=1 Tax=Cyanobium sp. BA20m-p-22 TaxID=2823704 RepID=UPI0020CE9250|nr:GIY-YIG nuclease family protein [Cyanobium sp. BA20m-p-22]MCP9911628.1 GIY-YIG nuclease family protein [Cyanobium sp. BA20m-p-22]
MIKTSQRWPHHTAAMPHKVVYVIRHLDTGLHKIGITNNWTRRKRELEVGRKTSPVHVVRVNDARQIESFLHRRFHANRMPQSEWFNLSAEQLEFARTTLLKASSDHQGHTAKTETTTLKPLAPPAPIVRAGSSTLGQPAPTTAPVAGKWWSSWVVALLSFLLPCGLMIAMVQQQKDLAAAQAAISAAELEKGAAEQAQAEQARLAADEEKAKQAALQSPEAIRTAALNRYSWFLNKLAAYDCRFYVWSARPGDPTVHLSGFSALPDAGPGDNAECSPPVSKTNNVIIPISPEEIVIRDKLLLERGQLPPEKDRFPQWAYRLDWPSS